LLKYSTPINVNGRPSGFSEIKQSKAKILVKYMKLK
jgi:hypothetical protein